MSASHLSPELQRTHQVKKLIGDAVIAVAARYPNIPVEQRPAYTICIVDWKRETPEAKLAETRLNVAMHAYVKGTVSLTIVRREWKRFIEAQKTYWWGAMPQEAPKR